MTASPKNISYLALGDSYTLGQGVNISECFPVLLSGELKTNGINVATPKIIAQTGWTTENLKKGIISANIVGQEYDIVSLLIGVNNYYDGGSIEVYESQFQELLLKSIYFARGDEKKVFVVSIPDYGYTLFGKSKQVEISEGIDRFNGVNKKVSASMGVQYFDIVPISRQGIVDPELIASDGLHPSGKMYKLWVDLMLKEIVQMIKN